jgi:hypothetical protein
MKVEKSNLYSRYKQDADACKNGYYGYELWLENKLMEVESELKKLRVTDVSGQSELLESFVKFVNERQFNQFQICLDEVELFLDSNCH